MAVECVVVKSAGCVHVLNLSEVDWLGAAGNYVELHVGSRSYLLRRTMKNMEGLLDPRRFLRIHRATIVNIGRIKELRVRSRGGFDVVLYDGVRLTSSRAYYRKKLLGLLREDQGARPFATSDNQACP